MSDPSLHPLLDLVDALNDYEKVEFVERYVAKHKQTLLLREDTDSLDDFPLMQEVKRELTRRGLQMQGIDATILACWHEHLSGAEKFNSKQLNTLLRECGCKPSNTSALLDTARARRWVDVVAGDEPGRHKTYRLTDLGIAEARRHLSQETRSMSLHAA